MTNDLIHRLEAAEGPSRELDMEIELFLEDAGFDEPAANWPEDCPAYTASLDAAVSLVPKGASWAINWDKQIAGISAWAGFHLEDHARSYGATPALSLCIAALKARDD